MIQEKREYHQNIHRALVKEYVLQNELEWELEQEHYRNYAVDLMIKAMQKPVEVKDAK